MKKIIYICLVIMGLFMVPVISCQAKTTLKSGTTKLYSENDDVDQENMNISLTTRKKMFLVVAFKIKNDDYLGSCDSGGLRIQVRNQSGKLIQNDYYSLKGLEENYYYNDVWFYTDDLMVPAGKYKYTFSNTSDINIKLTYKITGYEKFASSLKLKKTISVKSGTEKRIKLSTNPSGAFPFIKKMSCTKGLLKQVYQNSDGSLSIVGGRVKKGLLKIKLYNGKTFNIKINVTPGDPNFGAYLEDYYTRDNYFTVKIKNYGVSDLQIIRGGKGSKVENVDYKSFDRSIKASSTVVVKPGKTKIVRFYLKGSTTWYDVSDYTLFAKIKYQGKTYSWHVWDEDSVYKKGKKWYNTYFDEDWYGEWNYNVDDDY